MVYLFLLFGVVPILEQDNNLIVYWILARCVNKITKHFYNAYLAMGLRFEIYWIDYFRMTSFYVIYPTEYYISLALVF